MRNFQNWLKAYLQHTAHSESPTQFHFWTGVGTIAGALRRRVWIDQATFQWTPNFYIILVGPPGVAAKSTSMRLGMRLLEQVDGVIFGPASLTWHALIGSLQNAQQHIDVPGEIEPQVMSCLTIAASELGTLIDPSNRELMDVLVDMWDGQLSTWKRETKSSGNNVVFNPWLNILACTTPSWLTANFPEEMVGGGFTSRVIFVYGDKKRQFVAYPGQIKHPKDHKHEATMLADDLRQIGNLCGEYQLTPEAISWGTQWYQSLWTPGSRGPGLASERFDGYIARKQAHVHKLAIVLAAAKRNNLTIELEDLIEAEATVSSLESDMLKVFNSIGVAEEAAKTNSLLAVIRAHKEISYKKLWQLVFVTMSPEQFQEGVKAAHGAGYIRIRNHGGEAFLSLVEPEVPDANK